LTAIHVSDPRVDVRRQVFAALQDAGTAALAAVAALASGLEDPEPTVRIQALRVFAPRRPIETPTPEGALPNKLDPPEVLLPVVRRAFEDPILTVRWGAVAALSAIAPRVELQAVLSASEPKDPLKRQEWAAIYAELGRASASRAPRT
jgi:HEAT repeat protein